MKNFAMKLHLALCGAVLLLAAASAYAVVTIGNISVQSFRDETLEAYIELQTDAGETITLQCLSLGKPDTEAGNNLSYLIDASVSLNARDGRQTVGITTTQPIGGDGFNLLLKIQCPGQLQISRDFSVLLGTRIGNVLALPEQPQPAPPPTALGEARLPGPLPESGGFYWDIRSGETPASIAQKIYPKEPLYQKKMVRAIILANPQAFPDGQLQELSIGTVIIIPDLRSVPAVKVPGEGGGAEKSKSLRKSKPPPASQNEPPGPGKNAAGKPPPLACGSQYFLKISWQLASFPFSGFSEKPHPLTRSAPEIQNSYIAKVTELGQRLARLDSGLEEMRLRLATASSQAGQVKQALAQMEKTTVAVNTTPAPAQKAEARSNNAYDIMPWLAAGAVGFGALLMGLGAVHYYRKKSRSITSASTEKLDAGIEEDMPHSAPPSADHYVLEESSQHRPNMDLLLESAGGQAGVADEQVDVELLFDPTKSLVDDVDRLVALGRPKSAISLLLDQINKYKNDRHSWLRLLMLLHVEGMSSEFDKAEREFKSIFRDEVSAQAVTAITRKNESAS